MTWRRDKAGGGVKRREESADRGAVSAEIAEKVRMLNGLVPYRFGDDAELMGAWASARNVLGPFKPKWSVERGRGR
jgi:hypothetical protein